MTSDQQTHVRGDENSIRQQITQKIHGNADQVAGRDIINIKHLHITLGHGSEAMQTKKHPEQPFRLSEDQLTKLYHAKHLLAVLDSLALVGTASDRTVEINRESLAVVFGMARELVNEGMPED